MLLPAGLQAGRGAVASADTSDGAGADGTTQTSDAISAAQSTSADGSQGSAVGIGGVGGTASLSASVNAPLTAANAAIASSSGPSQSSDGSSALSSQAAIANLNANAAVSQTSAVTHAGVQPNLVRGFDNSLTQAPLELAIGVPVSDRGWSQAVATQVHWLASNDIQSATLRLSPPHLGPVEVQIDIQQSQVNVSFHAAHAETRSALEQSVPKLREMFASSGLTLGQATVQQESRPNSQPPPAAARAGLAAVQRVDSVTVATRVGLGLVDEYA